MVAAALNADRDRHPRRIAAEVADVLAQDVVVHGRHRHEHAQAARIADAAKRRRRLVLVPRLADLVGGGQSHDDPLCVALSTRSFFALRMSRKLLSAVINSASALLRSCLNCCCRCGSSATCSSSRRIGLDDLVLDVNLGVGLLELAIQLGTVELRQEVALVHQLAFLDRNRA